MKLDPIPAPGFHVNPGAYPDMLPAETQLRVQFANGYIDRKHTYKPMQLRWSLTGHDWDVAAVKPIGGLVLKDGRQANGSYE